MTALGYIWPGRGIIRQWVATKRIPSTTWRSDNQLKFTERELMYRGETADYWLRQVGAGGYFVL
jgi:hypothetical protein